MPTPFEIIASPVTLWIAPVATAFPLINAAPTSPWVKVGTQGDLNYTEDGVTVRHEQTTVAFRALGDGAPRKVFRTEESLVIAVNLVDVTLEQYALALNHNTITDTPPGTGVAGFRKIGLSRGFDVAQRALLLRGPSPYADAMNMQYEVPIAFQTGNPQPVYRKGEPVMLALEWTAIVDPSAGSTAERFGRLVAQDALPT